MSARDAVIVGAGHNGLAAAVMLADAGWNVTVVERNQQPGGAVRTEEVTLPGFRHDLFAANLNLFAGSAFHERYAKQLRDHGLAFAPSDRPFASVFPDDRFVGVSTDAERTRAGIAEISEADAVAWERLHEAFADLAPHLFPLLDVPLPSVQAVTELARGVRALGPSWVWRLARLVLQSPREFTAEHFTTPEMRALVATWGMHLDFSPEVSGGALFPFLETFGSATEGMVLGRGGAAVMIDALVSLLESKGGEVLLGSAASEIIVRNGRARGVALTDGRTLDAGRAVIANLIPPVLARLMPDHSLPPRFRQGIRRYRFGPGALMLHLATDRLPPWRAGDELKEYSYVHVGPYLSDMSRAYDEAVAGRLPARPTLVVGQPTAVDPSRAPEGRHVLWVQVRMVPGEITGDEAGEITATDWDVAKGPFADRVIDLIDDLAPGTAESILDRHVLSPADLERANPNLVGGDSLGGSHHLSQHFFLRPFPGWSRYETPVDGLFMCGAGTWPGAGLGAGSGYLLGRKLTESPLRRLAGRF